MAPRAFADQFGRITSENHFGARVVDGLVRFVDAKYWPEIRLKRSRAWRWSRRDM